jgi:hypothetical protein
LNPSIIAKAAVKILDNELVMAKRVFRGYEDEFEKKVNGYDVGDTISIRKPNQFTVRQNTATASAQDVTEGKLTLVVGNQSGVDFQFSAAELTLKISELAERVMKPALVQLANYVDLQVMSLYKDVYNYVGAQNGTTVASFAAFSKAPERLDLTSVPSDERSAAISPSDHWAVAGNQTTLFNSQIGGTAYREGSVGKVGDVVTYKTQNVPNHVTGLLAGSPLVNGAAQNVLYTAVQTTEQRMGISSLITDAWTASTTILKGDVFTIAGVFAVNPVTKATLAYLQQFVVTANVTADGSGNATLAISPAIITSGAFQTCSAVPADNAVITKIINTTGSFQNLVFHRNAFALACVPMVRPPGAVDCARESYKGLSVRVIPVYNGTSDVSLYRMDILFGTKTVDNSLAVRLGG